MIRLCFTVAIFYSAILLFFVQPLVGRFFLPVLGGSPAVWNTCLVFFQATLLAGYLYVDVLARHVSFPVQVAVHTAVFASATACLPVAITSNTSDGDPTLWLVQSLVRSVGLPFFALSATAPLLQRWFTRTSDPAARDPYFLYAASNAGSLAGLLAYPLLVEPLLSRGSQSMLFMSSFVVAAIAIVGCGLLALMRSPSLHAEVSDSSGSLPAAYALRVIALAALPSSLVLGVTQHLTSDVAALPLLWVAPLAVYLVTFMLSFARWTPFSAADWGLLLPFGAAPAAFLLVSAKHHSLLAMLTSHLAALFLAGMMCHRRLYEMRPATHELTRFYLLVSIGGVLGGAFNALVAPLMFSGIVEYPLAIACAFWLRPQVRLEAAGLQRQLIPIAASVLTAAALTVAGEGAEASTIDAASRLGIAPETLKPLVRAIPPLVLILTLAAGRLPVATAAAATGMMLAFPFIGLGGRLLLQERSFFGVHRVVLQPSGNWVMLNHGSTLHGVQARRAEASEALSELSLQPTTYYSRTGPLGDIVQLLEAGQRLQSIGVVGLGVGTVAAYAKPGMTLHFFEIDPTVCKIAADPQYFTYLADAAVDPTITLSGYVGDGRLRLAERPERSYDLIVIDAFASDSIPMHLLTREAVAMYAARLKPGGLLAFNVSNRYFNLAPPLGAIAANLGLHAMVRADSDVPQFEREMGKHESVWVVVGDGPDLAQLRSLRPTWRPIIVPKGCRVWTDDYGNLLEAFNGW
jgi:SAM-dependent methyltransferase